MDSNSANTIPISNDKWRRVAKPEANRLLKLVQRFPHPIEVTQALSDDVLITWKATWWQDCMGEVSLHTVKYNCEGDTEVAR
ncbi:hypothetical protein PHMEG_0007941 [Phytophthora megakarya]|uniref:Uncharacterized protein n=1 Tax=Phytophthora megakarya TaxID=4795 RepID=A0A225WJY5_9STRA|nr:hypothetical protein PHMEG_0007941 [Phytophthora megakarya]